MGVPVPVSGSGACEVRCGERLGAPDSGSRFGSQYPGDVISFCGGEVLSRTPDQRRGWGFASFGSFTLTRLEAQGE